MKKPSVVKYRR